MANDHPATSTNATGTSSSTAAAAVPQAGLLSAVASAGDSVYMDGEELELLTRYAADNPGLVSFQNTDRRVRSLEERLPEAELEKVLLHAKELLQQRRSLLTSDEHVQTLPLHAHVPSIVEFRETRNQIIQSHGQFATHQPFVNMADVFAKEVALSRESQTSLPILLEKLVPFFTKEVDQIPRKLLRYTERYAAFLSENAAAAMGLQPALQQRFAHLRDQYRFAQRALEVLTTFQALNRDNMKTRASVVAAGSIGADSAAGASNGASSFSQADNAEHLRQASHAKLAEELHPLFLRYVAASEISEYRLMRRWERFVSKLRLIPYHNRYEMYTSCMTHLIGGYTATGADGNITAVPLLTKDESVLSTQLDHLCSCFQLPSAETTDLQQFTFYVNRKYSVVFAAQSQDWVFHAQELPHGSHSSAALLSGKNSALLSVAGESGGRDQPSSTSANLPFLNSNAAHGDTQQGHSGHNSSNKDGTASSSASTVVLRVSNWLEKCAMEPIVAPWQLNQDRVLQEHAVLQSEAGRTIAAELTYLAEHDLNDSSTRWKKRVEAFHRRFGQRSGGSPGAAGSAGGMLVQMLSATEVEAADAQFQQSLPAGAQKGLFRAGTASGASGGEQSSLQHKLLAISQLRYLRCREFRRKILDSLNYFASLYRLIAMESSTTRTLRHSATEAASVKVPPIAGDDLHEEAAKLTNPFVYVEDLLDHQLSAQNHFAEQLLALGSDVVNSDVTLPAGTGPSAAAAAGRRTGGGNESSDTAGAATATPMTFAAKKADQSCLQHLDTYTTTPDGRIRVHRGSDGLCVMDQWALQELQTLEVFLTKMAVFYAERVNNDSYPNIVQPNDNGNKAADDLRMKSPDGSPTKAGGAKLSASQQGGGAASSPASATNVSASIDYSMVLEDLLESEAWFLDAKLKVLNCYRDAYEHCTDRASAHAIAQTILSLIATRPRLDLTDPYFTGSYTREVVNLELTHSLLREVLQGQITDERRLLTILTAPHKHHRQQQQQQQQQQQSAAAAGQPSSLGSAGSPSDPAVNNKTDRSGSLIPGATSSSTAKGGRGSGHATSVHSLAAAAGGASMAPKTSGPRIRMGEASEFVAAAARAETGESTDPLLFGLPDEPFSDTRLFCSLFPGSTVVNVMDLYTSIRDLPQVALLVQHAVDQIAQRFSLTSYPSAVQLLEREVLQECLMQWRLLLEEDKIARKMEAPVNPAVALESPGVDALDPSLSTMNEISHIDQIIERLVLENSAHAQRRRAQQQQQQQQPNGSYNNNNNKQMEPSDSDAGGPDGATDSHGLGPVRLPPAVSPTSGYYMILLELLDVRRSLVNALYETEILYGIHKRQGKLMGMTVKKAQLGPIDFDTRRAFAEVDDADIVKESENPFEEVLAIKTELLSNLAIAEFDTQMAAFEIQTPDGVRRLLSHASPEFRNALTVQLATKNMVFSAVLCNMAALDVFAEWSMYEHFNKASKQVSSSKFTYPVDAATGQALVRMRIRQFHAVSCLPSTVESQQSVGGANQPNGDAPHGGGGGIDRASLARYFISVNSIKTVYRKALLAELNVRTANVMATKKPEVLRKMLRDVKHALVNEYCVSITMATYQLSCKYHAAAAAVQLRRVAMEEPSLQFFVLGAPQDVLRPAPRGSAAVGESRRAATCMITRNGRVDEPRYVPHVFQLLAMDYMSKELGGAGGGRMGGGGGGAGASTGGSGGSSSSVFQANASLLYTKNNVLISCTARVLHNWTAILQLLRVMALLVPSPITHTGDAKKANNREQELDALKTELLQIQTELEGLRDPCDLVSIVDYLEGKHACLLLKLTAALNNSRFAATRAQQYGTAQRLNRVLKLLAYSGELRGPCNSALVTGRGPYVDSTLTHAQRTIAIHDFLTVDEKMKFGPYFGPVCIVKLFLQRASPAALMAASAAAAAAAGPASNNSNASGPLTTTTANTTTTVAWDLDHILMSLEALPPGSMQLHRDEDHFYSDLVQNPFLFVGDDVPVPFEGALSLLRNGFRDEELQAMAHELLRTDHLVEESKDDAESMLPMTLPSNRKGIIGQQNHGPQGQDGFSMVRGPTLVSHFEFLLHTARRENLRNFFFELMERSLTQGWQRQVRARPSGVVGASESDTDGGSHATTNASSSHNQSFANASQANIFAFIDDTYTRMVLARGRILCEREIADKNEARSKKRGAQGGASEREAARRQHQLCVMMINKLLILKARMEAEGVVSCLEDMLTKQKQAADAAVLQAKDTSSGSALLAANSSTGTTNAPLSIKSSIFTDFVRILNARALCTRGEGEKFATFHVPEASLVLAMDTVSRRLAEWQSSAMALNANAAETVIHALQQRVYLLEAELRHTKYLWEVDNKALNRRTQAAVVDQNYALLFANGALMKHVGILQQAIAASEHRIREDVRVEYQSRISHLESELMLSDQRFQSFKRKTFRDVQQSLEDIKRGAMLQVGKMESAPLQMKRQALRIAISDDELNTLKEQNAELKQAILKTKLWYEIKALRAKAVFEKEMKDSKLAIEATRTQFWENKESTEKELASLRQRLSVTQYQLSQSEIEVELLRKDLQVQVSNKKDLVSWKVLHAKALEDLQKKLKRFEPFAAYDLEQIVSEYEAKQAQSIGGAGGGGGSGSGPGAGSSSMNRNSTSGAAGGGGGDLTPRSRLRSAGTAGTSHNNGTAANAPPPPVSNQEHHRILEKLDRERKLKEQAFAKIDQLRSADVGGNEAMLWQRRYFEAASELQRYAKELESTRAFLAANGLTLPASLRMAPASAPPTSTAPQHTNPTSGEGMMVGSAGKAHSFGSAPPLSAATERSVPPQQPPSRPSAGGSGSSSVQRPNSRSLLLGGSASSSVPQASRLNSAK